MQHPFHPNLRPFITPLLTHDQRQAQHKRPLLDEGNVGNQALGRHDLDVEVEGGQDVEQRFDGGGPRDVSL